MSGPTGSADLEVELARAMAERDRALASEERARRSETEALAALRVARVAEGVALAERDAFKAALLHEAASSTSSSSYVGRPDED
eukprot:3694291-Prymnesium_polylepis.1